MTQYILQVIPQPAEGSAAVLVPSYKGEVPIFKGTGDHDFLCGACRNVVCAGADRGQFIEIVLQCPNCDSYNRARGT